MKPFTHEFKILKAIVVLTRGTDEISLEIEAPTPFPEMMYAPTLKMMARSGYGVEWCEKVLGITPEVIIAR